jgi:hypothetical protein
LFLGGILDGGIGSNGSSSSSSSPVGAITGKPVSLEKVLESIDDDFFDYVFARSDKVMCYICLFTFSLLEASQFYFWPW